MLGIKEKLGEPVIRKSMRKTVKIRKPIVRKQANKFITYGGYIQELDMFFNDGYYFKTYALKEPISEKLFFHHGIDENQVLDNQTDEPDFPGQVLHNSGFKIQIIAAKRMIYGVFGVKAELPEDAAEKFKVFEQSFFYPVVSCEEWFSVMAGQLRFEPFTGIPQGKRAKKTQAISLIQPYDVKIRQKDMEISRKNVKTLILTGYPSKLFPAFATELLEIADNLTLVVFAEEIPAERCLDGVNLSQELRVARKETMKDFLKKAIKEGMKLYNTCALVKLEGLPGEVEENSQILKAFCRKYLISASELDYQQSDAYCSTLPLLKNHIRYYRVLTEDNLRALLPWSDLKRCKQNVAYGEDIISGEIKYDRRLHQENGFILSSNYSWALMQARKEMQDYFSAPMTADEKISVLAGGNIESSLFGVGEKKTIQLSYDEAPAWLIRAAIIRWAVNGLSTNGRIMKPYMDMVLKAAEGLTIKEEKVLAKDENAFSNEEKEARTKKFEQNKNDEVTNGKQKGSKKLRENTYQVKDFIEQFLSEMGENERRALSIRPFITEYEVLETSMEHGVFYQVTGSGIQAELAYALLFYFLHGIVYSLNSELLAWNPAEMFRLHEDSMYTFLTQDNRTLYESKRFARLLKDAPFLLIGEHKIFEKLKLSEVIGLDKKQREWISEPAKGALLMTKLVTYQLKSSNGCRDDQKKERGD